MTDKVLNPYEQTIAGMQSEIHNLQMMVQKLSNEKSQVQKELEELRKKVGLD
jgi:FtsZ-binding cell division protein ZapB